MNNERDIKDAENSIYANQEAELERLDKLLKERKETKYIVEQQLNHIKQQFRSVQESKLWKLIDVPNKMKRFIRTTVSYILGRRNRKYLYSRKYRQKHAISKLKKYKYHLYQLGFRERALLDLENLYKDSNNLNLKSAAAWELALWYANKYTKYGAKKALEYIPYAVHKKQDKDLLRKAIIIKAECHGILDEKEVGKYYVQELLTFQKHPDLLLAAANLAETNEKRMEWINKALDVYGIESILLSSEEAKSAYDKLTTVPLNKQIDSRLKVTVIIPAYNAENGIKTAIDSILMQSWKNIELIVVDDCSTDSTVEVVSDYVNKDSRIKLLSTPENSGPYVARNIALKEATGDFVTINDSDDWVHAKKIETQVKHLIDNPEVIANTSEQARMTEELILHRRGNPGSYIFTNMSSLMFKRKTVIEEIGYWDEVRFAADSEFRKRLIRVFGKEKVVDLQTGPLSFQRQTARSLTGSSAFGYNGFLMGARKEYAEAHLYYHKQTDSLFYPFTQNERPFPVPEPMLPRRKKKDLDKRHFDIVIVGDFRLQDEKLQSTLEEIKYNKQLGLRTALIQMSYYNINLPREINKVIRDQLDGNAVSIIVYGEQITCENLIIKNVGVLQEKQLYIPEVKANQVKVVIDEMPDPIHIIKQFSYQVETYFDSRGSWYPADERIREKLSRKKLYNVRYINLSTVTWNSIIQNKKNYSSYLEDWTVDKNPYLFNG